MPARPCPPLAVLALLAIASFSVLHLGAFAPHNNHASPEMQAAWEAMMREG